MKRSAAFLSVGLLVGFLIAWAVIALGWWEPVTGGGGWGKFPRAPVVQLLDDGRKLQLLQDFAYVDPRGRVWSAPKDSVVDGASIPQVFFSFTGGPLDGSYRNASIVHDVACDRRTVASDDVHLMFYEACRCGGLSENKAKLLYAAVYHFGPHWDIKEEDVPIVVQNPGEKPRQLKIQRKASEMVERKKPTEEDAKTLDKFIHEKKPSLDALKQWPGKDK